MAEQVLTLSVNPGTGNNSAWTNPANALVSNNLYATFAPGTTSNRYFTYDTNAASVIPENAVILGVVITLEYRVSATTLGPTVSAQPSSSGIGGMETQSGTTTKATYTFGSVTDPMGAVTVADLAYLAVRVTQGTNGSVTHYLDHATMTVYWAPPGNAMFFGECF